MEKYTQIKVVGKGSFGNALLCRNKMDQNLYIVKEIPLKSASRRHAEATLNEAKVLAALRHPNIVAYKESFVEARKLHIVMDYADGGDLFTAIKNQHGVYFNEEVF